MTMADYNSALARVILSTKRKKRQYSLIEIASDIQLLLGTLGSLSEVSKVVGISTGMLSQFLSIKELPLPVLKLIADRKIDSITNAHYLTKFNSTDILEISKLLVAHQLTSQDLRALVPYRRKHSTETIHELVNKIQSSKDIKISVIRIPKEATRKSIDELRVILMKYVDSDSLNSVEDTGAYISIKLLKKGEIQLRKVASLKQVSLQDFVTSII
jgi:hypothetical protein